MSDFVTKGEDLKATVQALLEGRRMARSLENLADSLLPVLADSTHLSDAKTALETVKTQAKTISEAMQELFNRNAKEAFGANG